MSARATRAPSTCHSSYRVKPDIFTLDLFGNETLFSEAYDEWTTNGTGTLTLSALGGALLPTEQTIPDTATCNRFFASINNAVGEAQPPKAELEAYRFVVRNMRNEQEIAQHMKTVSGMTSDFANDTAKLFSAPTPGNYFTFLGVLEHPFSRRNVHLQSANASVYSLINPHYLKTSSTRRRSKSLRRSLGTYRNLSQLPSICRILSRVTAPCPSHKQPHDRGQCRGRESAGS